jgi:hypothetical protein
VLISVWVDAETDDLPTVVDVKRSQQRPVIPRGIHQSVEFLIVLAIAALVVAAISLFTTLPMVAATLRARRVLLILPAILLLDRL